MEKTPTNSDHSPYEVKTADAGTSVAVHHVVDGIDRGAELQRHFTPLAMLGLAFGLINSWTGE